MVVYKCDRCHKDITNDRYKHLNIEIAEPWVGKDKVTLDLCLDCLKEVQKYWKGEE